MEVYELNMDGLVGPSHHYAGLSAGNIASTFNAFTTANPAAAAHQGIAKMRLLHQMGLKQALLPPHQRPNLHLLHQLGFYGSPAELVKQAKKADLNLLGACYSASSMWTANAATVSASLDTQNHRVHFTAANLVGNLHRHQEADYSYQLLKKYLLMNGFFIIIHHCLKRLLQGMKEPPIITGYVPLTTTQASTFLYMGNELCRSIIPFPALAVSLPDKHWKPHKP
ncbi:succinylarginine dihydrolase [Legionella oakridgensis ATCC 33761 = DSM 21215]|uniref:Succinylarginine dihydrolase n=1 Tax=Legionella oakridgensis ATCC 33761 = DSM 21215 TaxID=1268635 RepID=W0BF78_9GAMM|nr:succinylarginine dihydrolase [Legionella oakridgensis ATCC 33761 = DSM 21215]